MKLHPYGNRILVRPDEAIGETKSGIILPDKAQKAPSHGIVVEVGPGDFRETDVQLSAMVWADTKKPVVPDVGTRVWYSKYGGTEVKFNGEDLLILSVGDIIAIETEGDAE